MTEQELEQLRRDKWRTNGMPLHTLEDAHAFIDSVGICVMFPLKPAVLLPSFLAAVIGEDRGMPTQKQAFADPRAQRAVEFAKRLVAQKLAFESNIFPENTLLLSPRVFPYFYVLAGERAAGLNRQQLSQLASLSWKILEQDGAQTREMLREKLGTELSITAIERALGELWMRLRVLPLERDGRQEWETLERWAPDVVEEGARQPMAVALSAMISQYLEAVVAAEPREIEEFFSHFTAKSKVKESENALLAAREFEFVNVGHRSLLHMTMEAPSPEPRGPRVRDTKREKRRA
jgi:hypothetical protein